MLYEQNRNINNEIKKSKKKPERNSGTENYNYRSEKLTRAVQRQIWASRRKNQITLRKDNWNYRIQGEEW